ncbi:hypothetical protein GH714_011196 [Hevea brasiliensis]|uniref:Rotamase n=1 Tax=Hevea brasiliensis TaxID=3981 RepID=A0A6A6N3X8_HEVBR|nr:hypothetical protein GH714_011196 [Hevea brasiliensis]
MDDAVDLTGDGGVIKTIIRQAKAGALAPSEDLPLVDGILFLVGEVAKITCKPKYAYGSTGSPPDIPPEELKKQRELAVAAKEEEKKGEKKPNCCSCPHASQS